MKTCPKCKMTLDAHCECPACKSDITKQPYSDAKIEHYSLNRYLFSFIFRKAKTFVFCLLVIIVTLILKRQELKFIYLLSPICLAFCFGETFYPSLTDRLWQSIYSESFLDVTAKVTKCGAAILSVFIVLFF